MSKQTNYTIRKATEADLDEIKKIADTYKQELGFILRPVLARSIAQGELMVAVNGFAVMGFVQYHHRRDEQTTLHNVVIVPPYRKQGIGQKLIQSLEAEAVAKGKSFILLKCPEELDANNFYRRIGYKEVDNEAGKSRRLNIWTKKVT